MARRPILWQPVQPASGAMSDALSLYAIGPASNGDPWGGVSVETMHSRTEPGQSVLPQVQSRVKGVSAEGIVDGQDLHLP